MAPRRARSPPAPSPACWSRREALRRPARSPRPRRRRAVDPCRARGRGRRVHTAHADLRPRRDAARDDALRALAARRASAQDCLAVWRRHRRRGARDLGIVYFEYLSGALWSVDAPLFRHWITDLRRSRRIDRSPVLARAADALRRDYAVANTIYTAVPDACATVTRWRDAG